MKKSFRRGILYPALALCVVMALLVSYTVKPGADAMTHSDLRRNIFLLDEPTGLSSQTTYSILKDKEGFLWISTRNGIDRYDGATFQHYKIGNKKMRGMRDGMTITLYCDPEGELWAYTDRSLIYRFNSREDRFDLILSMPDKKIYNSVQALYKYDNLLLTGGTDGVCCYNLTTQEIVKRILPEDNVRSLIGYKNGELLFGSQNGVGVIDLRELKGRQTGWIDVSVNNLNYDTRTNRLWVGGNGSGLYVIDPLHPEQKQFVKGTDGYVISQTAPFEQTMLVGVDGAGLWSAQIDTAGYVKAMTLLASDSPEAPHQLQSSSVRSLVVDGENVWVALYIGGIAHMQPPTQLLQLTNSHAQSPTEHFANGVNTDREGNIWVAYEKTIGCFGPNGENARFFLDHEGQFLTIQPAQDGTVWCGGYNTGIYHFNPKTGWQEHFNSIVDQPVKDCVYAIREDAQDNIWIGGLNFPLTRLHRNADNTFDKKSYDGVTLVTDIEWVTPDSVIVSTMNGLYLIDTSKDNVHYVLHTIEEWDGTNYISGIATRAGHEIWAATQGAGLICYDLNNQKKPITAFGLDNGLPSLELRGIEIHNDSILYISTEANGIFAFDCARRCYLNSLRHSDGLQNTLFLQSSSARDTQNRIIFGGNQCALVLKPTDLLSELHNFDIFVVGTGVYDNKVTLPHNARNLDLQFTTNDIYHQNEYNFYYRIKGITDEWQTIDNSRHVRFAQLPAGKYKLEIRAVSAANQSSHLSIQINAEQEPWLRWYSIAGYILAIILLTTIVMNFIHGSNSKE